MKKGNQLLKITGLMFLSFVLFASCKSDDTDAAMKVSLKMNKESAINNSLVFNSGSVTIREIVFDGEKTSGGSISITHEQISTIDLETGAASPAVNVIIPPGKYTSVNLGIEIQDVNSTPTIIAEGIYTDGNRTETPLRFEFNSGEVFEAHAPAHTFNEGASAIAEIDFSPADWFSTISMEMLDNAERVNGVILVNENTNSNIFDIVADKLDEATQAEFK